MSKLLLVFLLLLSFGNSNADENNYSQVGLVLDKKTCDTSKYSNIDLPIKYWPAAANPDVVLSHVNTALGVECKFDGIWLVGFIKEDVASTLKFAIKVINERGNRNSTGGVTLFLDSPGGLISESIKIGNFLATKDINAIVPYKSKCLSACVLVLAATSTRWIIGDVGIHRPFSYEISTSELTYDQYLSKYDEVETVMAKYFKKFGVSPALMDMMGSTPSDDMKILDSQTRDDWGLGYSNVARKEFEKAREIQICGKDYHDLETKFFNLQKSCQAKLGITVLDERMTDCVDLAHKTFPNYKEKSSKCRELKNNN